MALIKIKWPLIIDSPNKRNPCSFYFVYFVNCSQGDPHHCPQLVVSKYHPPNIMAIWLVNDELSTLVRV